ncbi:hypothetical protein M1146_08120 [Patescibacteria group bacterium]|nr:hypothetical protein [Patescibacteria group bacterium]
MLKLLKRLEPSLAATTKTPAETEPHHNSQTLSEKQEETPKTQPEKSMQIQQESQQGTKEKIQQFQENNPEDEEGSQDAEEVCEAERREQEIHECDEEPWEETTEADIWKEYEARLIELYEFLRSPQLSNKLFFSLHPLIELGFTVKLAEMAMETCKNDLELAADLLQDLRDDIVLSNQHPTEYVHTDEWLKGERRRVRR